MRPEARTDTARRLADTPNSAPELVFLDVRAEFEVSDPFDRTGR